MNGGVQVKSIDRVIEEVVSKGFERNGKTPDIRSIARIMSVIYRSPDPEVYKLCDSYTSYATA